jgi:hypothetical protein
MRKKPEALFNSKTPICQLCRQAPLRRNARDASSDCFPVTQARDYFTYVFYYRWEAEQEDATIYALMYCNREPGYWKHRIG